MSWVEGLTLSALVALAATLALPYVVGPIAIWLRTRIDAETPFTPVDGPFPADVEAAFARFGAGVGRRGFVPAGRFRFDSKANGQSALVAAFCDPARSRWAVAYAAFDAAGRPATRWQDVCCRLADGGVLSVDTAKIGGVFDTPPGWRSFRFPEVDDGELLARLHEIACERSAGGRIAGGLVPEDVRGAVEELGRLHVVHQVERGLFRPGGDPLRPTLRGAAVMAWRLLWPWKGIAARRRRREAMELLAHLPAAGPDGFVTPPAG